LNLIEYLGQRFFELVVAVDVGVAKVFNIFGEVTE